MWFHADEMGIYDIPIHNVSNACATGSNALFLARNLVQGGLHHCVLALGVEKMVASALVASGATLKMGEAPRGPRGPLARFLEAHRP